jgi:hypothetical protein
MNGLYILFRVEDLFLLRPVASPQLRFSLQSLGLAQKDPLLLLMI